MPFVYGFCASSIRELADICSGDAVLGSLILAAAVYCAGMAILSRHLPARREK